MYNRYVGNTGKVVRVEEETDRHSNGRTHHESEKIPHHSAESAAGAAPRLGKAVKKPSFLSGLGGGLLKSVDSALPFGLETADLILLALFLFLYMESADEEFLIILGFLAYSIFKENKEKE